MVYNLRTYFLLFMIYAVIGWFVEVITMFKNEHKFINRGFLIGPYCPIYGYGSIVITFLLSRYQKDIFILFGMTVFVCTILEYITSYLMEKIFGARWWDYSTHPFHINGRVCLGNAILFGLGGVLIVKGLSPLFLACLTEAPSLLLNTVTLILLSLFIGDNILSIAIMNGFKKDAKKATYDQTEEITREVRNSVERLAEKIKRTPEDIGKKIIQCREGATQKIKSLYEKKSYFHKRLIRSFPHFQTRIKKTERIIQERNHKTKEKGE